MKKKEKSSKVLDRHVECRVLGHSWRFFDAWKEKRNFMQTMLCRNCGTERSELISGTTGEVLKRKYDYTQGYLLEGGLGNAHLTREDRGMLRLRMIGQKGLGSAG